MKNTDKKTKISAIQVITIICCAFLAVGVMAIFHACSAKEDGTWMSCHYAQLAVFALGLVMTILSVAAVMIRQPKAAGFLYIVIAICALAAAIIPGNVIHLCMMNEMQCRRVMRPSVILVSILIILFSLLSFAGSRKKK